MLGAAAADRAGTVAAASRQEFDAAIDDDAADRPAPETFWMPPLIVTPLAVPLA